MDRKFVISAFMYALLGLLLGIYMSASRNHGQYVTHAHIMLAGFLLSFSYGICHKLWLGNPISGLARAQFYIHHIGAIGLLSGLYLMFGGHVPGGVIGPFLGISSIVLLVGFLLMVVQFLKSKDTA